jgi:hypothetical protein
VLVGRRDGQNEVACGITGPICDTTKICEMDKFGLKPTQASSFVVVAFGEDWLQSDEPCEASKIKTRGLCCRRGDRAIDIEVTAGIDCPRIQVLTEDGN